jgi:predicted GNAT superfamily acetyltransferase
VSGDHQIRTLNTRDEMESLLRVAEAVWGPPAGSMVSPDFLMALAHTGGYVAGLFDVSPGAESAAMVGCSFGMLGRFRGDLVLHSHITGVVHSLQHRGLGRTLKQHQRSWARDNDLSAITWTFDPLVRRNGWFNLHCLGATAEEYHVDFYGPLGDAINGTDESDRLLAYWDIASTRAHRAAERVLPTSEPQPGDVLVATPGDIIDIRRHAPDVARHWRTTVREQLVDAFDTSHIVGMTHDGAYVVRPRDPTRETRHQ